VAFLLARLDEDQHVSGLADRHRDEIAARRELIRRLGAENRSDLLRVLLAPYRDYPEVEADWFM
jgi:hypothetical protein